MNLYSKIESLRQHSVNAKPLSSKERNNLPSSDFVFKKERKFPIQDLTRAKDALARASAIGGKIKDKVFRAVHSRYPNLYKKHSALKEYLSNK